MGSVAFLYALYSQSPSHQCILNPIVGCSFASSRMACSMSVVFPTHFPLENMIMFSSFPLLMSNRQARRSFSLLFAIWFPECMINCSECSPKSIDSVSPGTPVPFSILYACFLISGGVYSPESS